MNRLMIVEGLPCSGKSTASKYIAEKTNAVFYDEGSGDHPADYEFHAYVKNSELGEFSPDEQELIRQKGTPEQGGYIVPLREFGGGLFDRLLRRKIYDFLPWETEKPLMLGKWEDFVKNSEPDRIYVFNCVLLQNPMCETMMRFGFDKEESFEYISSVCDIIRPMEPFIVYLASDDIRAVIEKTAPERGEEWLNSVIDYHCGGAYGKAHKLKGFDGYIAALEERQRRETEILKKLNVDYTVISGPLAHREDAYSRVIRRITEGKQGA